MKMRVYMQVCGHTSITYACVIDMHMYLESVGQKQINYCKLVLTGWYILPESDIA